MNRTGITAKVVLPPVYSARGMAMSGNTGRTLTIEEVSARFEQWRQNRKGRAAIPDELWSAAMELARNHGRAMREYT